MIVGENTKIYVGEVGIKKVFQGNNQIYGDNLDYVKDKLILLYDGIENTEHGHQSSGLTVWKNLVGDVNLAFRGTTKWQITDNGMRLYIPLNGSYQDISVTLLNFNSPFSFSGQAWTVEQYVTITSGGSYMDSMYFVLLYNLRDNGIPDPYVVYCDFLKYDEQIAFGGYVGDFYRTPTSYAGKTVLLSTVYTGSKFQIYIDGVLVAESTVNFNTSSVRYINFGPARGQYATSAYKTFDMTWHNIRCYDKALTAEEVQHNYEIDKKRFK